MKKSIIMVLVFCTGVLIAQDIAGTYRAGGQRVEYQYYTRPNFHLPSGNATDYSTSLEINDAYGLGVNVEVSNIPAGYNFYENVVGPIGLAEMDALQYFLYVTFDESGDAAITNSQVLAGETEGCVTEIQLLPLDDEFAYTSDLDAGLTIQSTMVTGQPNASPYVGETAGSWSVDGSSFFSFFPATPSAVTAEFQLYGAEFAECYGYCVATGADGMFTPGSAEAHQYCGGVECAGFLHGYPGMPHPGATAGYVVDSPATSSVPSNMYYGLVPDLHIEWHYIDGPVAETGLGDIVGEDEDGDGSDYDNILGYPALNSTFMNPACGFNYPILGDVTAIFESMGMGTCVDYTVGGDETAAGTDAANAFYLMDAQFGPWGNFLTWNGTMYGLTGDASFLVDDSGADVNPADITFLDLDGDGVPETPYNANGGRLTMTFEPTCIPVVTSISVIGELFEVGCGEASGGDVNQDGSLDVLDVVAVVSFILGGGDLDQGCADVNSDGGVDVLDVVAMVSNILGNNARSDASSAVFNKAENGMTMSSDGLVGAVQMTLSHGSDFIIDLTDDAFVADYNTDGNTTTLIVVAPENDAIFSSTGDYNVEEVIAATTNGYIDTEVTMPDAIALGKAYPNPFNPSTSFDVNIASNGNVSVMVYNVNGQIVDVVQDGYMDAGSYNMTWNASDLSSGMYIVKASAAGITASQKIMLVK